MQLYLLRHADAETTAPSDAERPLSAKGKDQARRVGRFCAANDIRPDLILSSPLIRAKQTAQPVAETTGCELVIARWIAAGMSPHDAIEQLGGYRDRRSVMLVGHEPDFSQLIALLLGLASPTQWHVRKASLTALEVAVVRAGAARCEWSLPCQMM